jgi:DNA-directed RNA polymerase specialized sigma24 family protein
MLDDAPITEWIARLEAGDADAAEGLFWAYFDKLMRLACSQMTSMPLRAEGEEDAAQSAMKSYFRGVAAGRFEGVQNRRDLWRLLATITARKVVARQRRFHAQKRPQPLDEAALRDSGYTSGVFGLEQVIGRDPSPDAVAEFTDELRARLASLPDDDFREIVILRLEGLTTQEIADKLGTYKRKIERRLEIVRKLWVDREYNAG